MAKKIKNPTPEQTKAMRESMAKELWLLYFNNVLYEKGVITEKQRNQMKNKISTLVSDWDS